MYFPPLCPNLIVWCLSWMSVWCSSNQSDSMLKDQEQKKDQSFSLHVQRMPLSPTLWVASHVKCVFYYHPSLIFECMHIYLLVCGLGNGVPLISGPGHLGEVCCHGNGCGNSWFVALQLWLVGQVSRGKGIRIVWWFCFFAGGFVEWVIYSALLWSISAWTDYCSVLSVQPPVVLLHQKDSEFWGSDLNSDLRNRVLNYGSGRTFLNSFLQRWSDF